MRALKVSVSAAEADRRSAISNYKSQYLLTNILDCDLDIPREVLVDGTALHAFEDGAQRE